MDGSMRSGRSAGTSWAPAALIGLGIAVCACSATTTSTATPEVDVGQGKEPQFAQPPDAAGDSAHAGAAKARVKGAPLPPDFASLGQPCPAEPDPASRVQVICGQDHRIAALWQMNNGFVPQLPAPVLEGLPYKRVVPGPPLYTARVHLDGEHLWISSACQMCRVPSESLWIGDLALVTDEEIGKVQMQMGLPQKPALRDEKAWKAALAKKAD